MFDIRGVAGIGSSLLVPSIYSPNELNRYMTKPLALDLFCCSGGASMGLHRAGFDVIGVDIKSQPRYPFRFVQGDALNPPFDLRQFAFIWASPPCQAHTALKTMHNAKEHADLIPATRALLKASGVRYVIENVVGAPLHSPILLCGTMFGLGIDEAELRRHRIFETGPQYWSFPHKPCRHRKKTIGVYGGGHGVSLHRHAKGVPCFTAAQEREAMDMPWASVYGLSQAIPPAYAECIGRAALVAITTG
jgi:DNA (cytosine-5)-methyltransferase 1